MGGVGSIWALDEDVSEREAVGWLRRLSCKQNFKRRDEKKLRFAERRSGGRGSGESRRHDVDNPDLLQENNTI